MGFSRESGINIISLYSMKLITNKILGKMAPMEDWDGWISGGPSNHGFHIPVEVSDYLEPAYTKLGILLHQNIEEQLKLRDLKPDSWKN